MNMYNNIAITQRDASWDSLKTFLIYLVILGHLLTTDQGYAECALHTFIFLFHMPLFAFVSGYFTNTSNKERLYRGTFKIFETLVVWHIVGYIIIGLYFWHLEFSIRTILTPIWHYWYLFSLICWRVLAYFLECNADRKRHYYIIPITFIFALLVGFFTFIGDPLSLSRTFVFGPFFMAGWCLRDTKVMNDIRNPRYNLLSLSIVMIFIVFVLLFPNWGRSIYGDDPYVDAYDSASKGFLMRVAYIISASILCLTFTNLWSNIKFLANNGKFTLGVLIYHSWFILMAKIVGGVNIFTALPISIVIYCLCNQLASSSLSKWLLNPITQVKKWYWGG